jgi:3-deoxy-D-manno-octulosonic-acid transferase
VSDSVPNAAAAPAAPAVAPLAAPLLPPLLPPLWSDPRPGLGSAVLHAFYDALWLIAALVGSPWLLWRSLRRPGFARMLRERLGAVSVPPSARRRVLVHGVSVGEIKGALPLVRALRERHPELEFVISATTDTGLAVARDLFPDLGLVRFPLDLSWVVRRFLRELDPLCVVLVELEVWPNFLREANRAGVPIAVVNGRITDKSHSRYRWFKHLLPQFARISLFCAQGDTYAQRFLDLGADPRRVVRTGNLKADGLHIGRQDPGDELRRLLGGAKDELVIVAGSTHAPEELAVVEAWRAQAPSARLILVPRHPPRCAELERDLAASGVRVQRLSVLRAGTERPERRRPALVDTIGELERVYALADLVFVGGSLLPHGGQNVLEPAAQGLPVIFGPYMHNFTQEARLLLDAQAAVQLVDTKRLSDVLGRLARDAGLCARMGAAALEVAKRQKGATALTVQALEATCLVQH